MRPWRKEIGGEGAAPGFLLRRLCWAKVRYFQKKPLTRNKALPEAMGVIWRKYILSYMWILSEIVTQAIPFFQASLIDSFPS